MGTAIRERSLSEISAALAAGGIAAADLCEACLEAHDPALHAYRDWAPDFARRQAAAADAAMAAGMRLGPLQGIPVSVKDLYGVRGFQTFAGSPRALPAAWEREGPVVEALRRQLAVVTGKTHTVEFAYGGLGTSAHWPVPWNPRDRRVHRAPGGSSSGAGVSLIEGTALLALGTDTGGSVRIPASLTGTAGLKTTIGRWSQDGIVPLSPSLDTPGLLARTAEDLTFAFTALDGEAVPEIESVAGLRIGIAESFFFEATEPGIAERIGEAAAAIEAAGATLLPLALPGAAEVFDLYFQGGIVAPELHRLLTFDLPEWLPTLDPRVKARMAAGQGLSASNYLQRKARYAALGAGAAAALAGVDVVVSPTVPISPPAIADLVDDAIYARLNMLALRNTCVVSFLGLCALTLPVGLDAQGLPVGLQLIAPPRGEAKLLAIAQAIERRLAQRGIWSFQALRA